MHSQCDVQNIQKCQRVCLCILLFVSRNGMFRVVWRWYRHGNRENSESFSSDIANICGIWSRHFNCELKPTQMHFVVVCGRQRTQFRLVEEIIFCSEPWLCFISVLVSRFGHNLQTSKLTNGPMQRLNFVESTLFFLVRSWFWRFNGKFTSLTTRSQRRKFLELKMVFAWVWE